MQGLQAVAVLPTGGAAGVTALLQHETVMQVATESSHAATEVLLKWSTQRGTPVIVDCATASGGNFDVGIFFGWRMSEERHKVLLDAMNQDRKFA
jgi:diketogulonate reductase-like aldo/keto reductase